MGRIHMACIFCQETKNKRDFSKEHVFPEAIGGSYLIFTVCRDCNSLLGHSVDPLLTEHPFIQFERHILRISGKSGKIPFPLKNGVLTEDTATEVRIEMNHAGIPHVVILPSVKRERREDGKETISIGLDSRDSHNVEKILNKVRTRSNNPPLTAQELLSLEKREIKITPTVTTQLNIDTFHFHRAILKIVYELACEWLGTSYLSDETGMSIRKHILDPEMRSERLEKYSFKGIIEFYDIKNDPQQFFFWKDEPHSHIAYSFKNIQGIFVCVRIFKSFWGTFLVTGSTELYPDYQDKFLSIDPVSGKMRNYTLSEEISSMSSSISF